MTDPGAGPLPAPRPYDHLSDDDIVVLPWPPEAEAEKAAASGERARLYIVAEGAKPPPTWGAEEDWLRAPVNRGELDARRDRLRRRVDARRPVRVDEFGLVRRGRRWVAASPLEACILTRLLVQPGDLVSRDDLFDAAPWGTTDDRRLLDATICRLRRRIRPLGVRIHTIRAAGYILELEEPPSP